MTREDVQVAWEKIVAIGFLNYDLLTKDQKVWFNIEPLTTDGIINHYINHGAGHNQDTIDALEFLKFKDIAEQMRKINALFTNGHPPVDIDGRNEQWNTWCDENESLLDKADDIFWDRSEELERALLEHIISTKIGVI